MAQPQTRSKPKRRRFFSWGRGGNNCKVPGLGTSMWARSSKVPITLAKVSLGKGA